MIDARAEEVSMLLDRGRGRCATSWTGPTPS